MQHGRAMHTVNKIDATITPNTQTNFIMLEVQEVEN